MNMHEIGVRKSAQTRAADPRRPLALIGLAFALLAPMSVQAQIYDARDVALLPEFCRHTQDFRAKVPGGSDPAQIAHWESVLGPIFLHMHHYCYGLVDTNRATFFARDPQDRMRLLKGSINEFNYVIGHAGDDFILLPEILTKKGENLIRLGEGPAASAELQRAIQLKPDYWPPYAAMSDYYRNGGNVELARQWLDKALAIAPDAVALKERSSKLAAARGQRKAHAQSAAK